MSRFRPVSSTCCRIFKKSLDLAIYSSPMTSASSNTSATGSLSCIWERSLKWQINATCTRIHSIRIHEPYYQLFPYPMQKARKRGLSLKAMSQVLLTLHQVVDFTLDVHTLPMSVDWKTLHVWISMDMRYGAIFMQDRLWGHIECRVFTLNSPDFRYCTICTSYLLSIQRRGGLQNSCFSQSSGDSKALKALSIRRLI